MTGAYEQRTDRDHRVRPSAWHGGTCDIPLSAWGDARHTAHAKGRSWPGCPGIRKDPAVDASVAPNRSFKRQAPDAFFCAFPAPLRGFKKTKLYISLFSAFFSAMLAGVPRGAALGQSGSLTDAYKIISSRQFVDLTHSFSPLTPVWKGFGQAVFAAEADPETGRPYTIDKDGFRAFFYSMVGQYGTHIDPPAHFDPNGKTMDEIPLKQMILPMVVFDITPMLRNDPNHALTVGDISTWEKRHGRVPVGAFAALRTDMYKDWDTNPDRFKRNPFPAWSFDAIRFLYEQRGIVANGHESMDTDTTADLKSERWLLRHGHWQIEVMANFDKVPATGALIIVTWPKPLHGLGFPARAFAILP